MLRQQSSEGDLAFTAIDTREKAEALVRTGVLEKLFLLPLEFGGSDVPQNVVYVPHGIRVFKERLDATIVHLRSGEYVSKYRATPHYRGASIVPVRILVKAWSPREFSGEVDIW